MACFLPPEYDQEESENSLHYLMIRAAEQVKARCKLQDCRVDIAIDILIRQLKNYEWQRNHVFSGIDYNDIYKSCGYMQRYATCHSALARHATLYMLRKIPTAIKRSAFENKCLNVLSAGGGPGNDLMGFCCALQDSAMTFDRLNLTVVDFKAGWQIMLDEVMSIALPAAPDADYSSDDDEFKIDSPTTYKFVGADLTYTEVEEIFDADVILMVKVLSNVSQFQKDCILKNIFTSMKEGAIFLYTDINASSIAWASRQYRDMKVLISKEFGEFQHSVRYPLTQMIKCCTYGICVIQKTSTSVWDRTNYLCADNNHNVDYNNDYHRSWDNLTFGDYFVYDDQDIREGDDHVKSSEKQERKRKNGKGWKRVRLNSREKNNTSIGIRQNCKVSDNQDSKSINDKNNGKNYFYYKRDTKTQCNNETTSDENKVRHHSYSDIVKKRITDVYTVDFNDDDNDDDKCSDKLNNTNNSERHHSDAEGFTNDNDNNDKCHAFNESPTEGNDKHRNNDKLINYDDKHCNFDAPIKQDDKNEHRNDELISNDDTDKCNTFNESANKHDDKCHCNDECINDDTKNCDNNQRVIKRNDDTEIINKDDDNHYSINEPINENYDTNNGNIILPNINNFIDNDLEEDYDDDYAEDYDNDYEKDYDDDYEVVADDDSSTCDDMHYKKTSEMNVMMTVTIKTVMIAFIILLFTKIISIKMAIFMTLLIILIILF